MMIKKKDLWFMAILLLTAGVLYLLFRGFYQAPGAVVRVTVDGKEYRSDSITKNQDITVQTEWGENTIRIKDGEVRMEQSDCPNQYCVRHKAIHLEGETIVCLPHRLVVEIMGGEAEGEIHAQ